MRSAQKLPPLARLQYAIRGITGSDSRTRRHTPDNRGRKASIDRDHKPAADRTAASATARGEGTHCGAVTGVDWPRELGRGHLSGSIGRLTSAFYTRSRSR